MKKMPPSFPFFEVPAVGRSVLPVLSIFSKSSTAPAPSYTDFKDTPNLDVIINSISTGNASLAGIPATGFAAYGLLSHEEAYKRLAKLGKKVVLDTKVIDDKGAEANAWEAAKAFGEARKDKHLIDAPGITDTSSSKLVLRAVFSSVWVEHPTPDEIPYVLDQLWVIERIPAKPGFQSYYLLCVEIDGQHKWDTESNGSGQSNLTKQITRSNYLLGKGIGLYRIASTEMKVKHQSDGEESVGDALPGTQMTLLATRLCE
jgi:hypothetical protein